MHGEPSGLICLFIEAISMTCLLVLSLAVSTRSKATTTGALPWTSSERCASQTSLFEPAHSLLICLLSHF